MYLYNVSLIVEASNHEELLAWTQQFVARNTDTLKLLKMLDSPHEGYTYCLQSEVKDDKELQRLRVELIQELQEHINHHHAEKAFLFESVMQYLP